jgi:hypothetical protein
VYAPHERLRIGLDASGECVREALRDRHISFVAGVDHHAQMAHARQAFAQRFERANARRSLRQQLLELTAQIGVRDYRSETSEHREQRCDQQNRNAMSNELLGKHWILLSNQA